MNKKYFAIFIALISILISSPYKASVQASGNIGISAKSAILIDATTGEVLFDKNSTQIMQMASTTKIMTTLLSIESGNLDEWFVVDLEAIKVEGSSMGLVECDQVTKRALCYGMMLPSGNDSANATAVKITWSIEKSHI